jgi:hypothetical protein
MSEQSESDQPPRLVMDTSNFKQVRRGFNGAMPVLRRQGP